MAKYELGVIYRPNLEEEVLKSEMEKVQDLVTRFGGAIEKVDDWGRRRLAYEIQKVTEGVFSFITFTAETTTPIEIETRIRIMENVMRFLMIRLDD